MKRRLRKKLHLGEFQKFGVRVHLSLAPMDAHGFIDFLDEFLREAVEANGCYCGGGGAGETYSFYIELGRGIDECQQRLGAIVAWLESRDYIQEVKVGMIHDAEYGPFDDE